MRIGINKVLKIGKIIGILLIFQLFFVTGGANRGYAAFLEVVPPDDNTTIIYVYRLKSMVGLMAPWNVRLDGNIETILKNNTYTVLLTTPGEHSITIGDSEAANFFAGGVLGRASGAYDAINDAQLAKEAKKGTLPDSQPSDSSDGSAQKIFYFRSKGAEVEYVSRDQALREMARLTYEPSSSSKGRKLLFSQVSQPSDGAGSGIDGLLDALHSPDSGTKRNAVRTIAGSYSQNEVLLEAVEEELLKGYNENTEDKYQVDAIAWMCKALSASGDARYRESLTKVADSATNKKIKKYAQAALEQLNQAPTQIARSTSEPGSSSKVSETNASVDAPTQNATETQINAVSSIPASSNPINNQTDSTVNDVSFKVMPETKPSNLLKEFPGVSTFNIPCAYLGACSSLTDSSKSILLIPGTVSSIDSNDKIITVNGKPLVVTDATIFRPQALTLADIQAGDEILFNFIKKQGKLIAIIIVIEGKSISAKNGMQTNFQSNTASSISDPSNPINNQADSAISDITVIKPAAAMEGKAAEEPAQTKLRNQSTSSSKDSIIIASTDSILQNPKKMPIAKSGIEISLTKVEVKREGQQVDGSFKVMKGMVNFVSSGVPRHTTVRPTERGTNPENDGVLAVTGRIEKGEPDVFWAIDSWITNVNGNRNDQNDAAGLSNGREFTLMFNVPMNSPKLFLHFGDALEIDLVPFLKPAHQ